MKILFPAVLMLTIAAVGTARADEPAGTPAAGAPTEAAPPPMGSGGAMAVDTAAGFGRLGQIAVSGELQFSILRTSLSMGGGSNTAVVIQPSLDYFVAPNVSVGGAIVYAKEPLSFGAGSADLTTIGVLARGGYNVHLTEILSLWAQAQLGYAHTDISSNGVSTTGYSIPFGIFAPLLWHPTPHLFIGAGPVFATDLVSKSRGADAPKTTSFGIQSVVGGYLGGR